MSTDQNLDAPSFRRSEAVSSWIDERWGTDWWAGRRLLCLGRGAGPMARRARNAGAAVEWLSHRGERATTGRDEVAPCQLDLDTLSSLPKSYDLVVILDVLNWLTDPAQLIVSALRAAPRVLVATDVVDELSPRHYLSGDSDLCLSPAGHPSPWNLGYHSIASPAYWNRLFADCRALAFPIVSSSSIQAAADNSDGAGFRAPPLRDSRRWSPDFDRLWLLRPRGAVQAPTSNQISVVVQGPVAGAGETKSRYRLTQRCLNQIRRVLPGAELILSTWDGADTSGLAADRIIYNADPGGIVCDDEHQVRNNVNRQLVSSAEGIRHASRPYCLKIRSDLLLFGDSFLRYWGLFPERDVQYQFTTERLLSSSIFARRRAGVPGKESRIIFHPSDFLFFGFRDCLLNLFDVPLAPEPETSRWFQEKSRPVGVFDCYPHALCRFFPEQYLWLQFLNKFITVTPRDRLDIYHPACAHDLPSQLHNLVVLDQDQWRFTLPKYHLRQYSMAEYDWNGLFRHQVWRQLYGQWSGQSDPAPRTYDSRMRYIFHDSHWARQLARKSPRLFRYLHRRLRKQWLFP